MRTPTARNHMSKNKNRVMKAAAAVFVLAVFFLAFALGRTGPGSVADGLVLQTASALSAQRNVRASQDADRDREVPTLQALLPGLEAKVAAHPEDLGQRILLAQTYIELGEQEKALRLLRTLSRELPEHPRVSFLLAGELQKSSARKDQEEAFALFSKAARDPDAAPLARFHQGQIRMQQGDAEAARALWTGALAGLPEQDAHRALLEDTLAHASAPHKTPGPRP